MYSLLFLVFFRGQSEPISWKGRFMCVRTRRICSLRVENQFGLGKYLAATIRPVSGVVERVDTPKAASCETALVKDARAAFLEFHSGVQLDYATRHR